MSKTKLTFNIKNRLRDFVSNEIVDPDARLELEDMHFKCTASILEDLRNLYPQDDMAVLSKHGCASIVTEVRFECKALKMHYWDERMTLLYEAKCHGTSTHSKLDYVLVPVCPSDTPALERTESVTLNDNIAPTALAAYLMWKTQKDIVKQVELPIKEAYLTLIENHKFLEDLAEVWPEVRQILQRPIVALNPDLHKVASIVQQNTKSRLAVSEANNEK